MELKTRASITVLMELTEEESQELRWFLEKMDEEGKIQGNDYVYKLMTELSKHV